MAERRLLPEGMTPRMLSRVAAAAYLGISRSHFEDHVAGAVPPIKIGSRSLWDIKALDLWLDAQSGLAHPIDSRSIGERLNGGDQGARR